MRSEREPARILQLGSLVATFLMAIFLLPVVAARAQQSLTMPELSAPQESEAPQSLHLLVGRSIVISSPTRIRRLSIADPAIADALIINPTQVLINGKVPGGVSLVLWNEADQSQVFELFVDMDILALSQKIREVFPHEAVHLEASKDLVVLSGHISSKAVADRIVQIVSAVNPKVVSLMDAPGKPTTGEVLLEVRFAEVDRSALTQVGFNIFSLGGGIGAGNTIGVGSTQQFGPGQLQGGLLPPQTTTVTTAGSTSIASTGTTNTGQFTLSDLLNIFVFRPDINLAVAIKALQGKNLLQILAEPNLLTQTGKTANFLAGGQFPFPVVQGGAAGSVPTVTIQFKEFGVRLNFTPDITEEGRIHLKVSPEVSALDFSNALTLSGFTVPAISTRRVETEVELSDGQGFAIAGLVDNRLTQVMSKVPLLGDIPILGQFFRSRQYNKSNTELLVLVTPHIVKPYDAKQAPPLPPFDKPFMSVPPASGAKPAAEEARPSAPK